jgi:prepilin-type N-terminal cleavage/methylation domain-containing protein/prepilin-type processing-associated H-X9-DG protein
MVGFAPRGRGNHNVSARRAFTLVELLVVIGIIAVLVGILLPTLGRARKSARTTACLSGVRQLCMAMQQYMNDNGGQFSPYYNGSGGTQFQISWMAQLVKPQQLNGVRLCPEAMDAPNPKFSAITNNPGGAFYAWGPKGNALQDPNSGKSLTGSYCLNGYLLRLHSSGNNGSLVAGSQAGSKDRLLVPPFRNSSETPVLSDGVWSTGWPKETDAVPDNLYDPARLNGANMDINYSNMARICVARHFFAINVGYLDGHAATVPLPELWQTRWHRQWVAPTGAAYDTIKVQLRAKYKR